MKNIVMNTVNVLSVLFVCLAYCACGGESAGNTLKIAGGTAHLKVMGEIGEMMKAKTPGLTDIARIKAILPFPSSQHNCRFFEHD